jgi:hypothetical protein
MLPECKKANDLSAAAKKSGSSDDHAAAARAHDTATKAAFKSGDPVAGKEHAKKAAKHRAKAKVGKVPVLSTWAQSRTK